MRLNECGNSYPEGKPIFKVEIIKKCNNCFEVGDTIEVMESLNPYFKNMWRYTDSVFISKNNCKII